VSVPWRTAARSTLLRMRCCTALTTARNAGGEEAAHGSGNRQLLHVHWNHSFGC
jgi:hypothetical protein